jgi:hypothetical protein
MFIFLGVLNISGVKDQSVRQAISHNYQVKFALLTAIFVHQG